jgi:Rrf2 family cysteine metabolism transcriptional repressor
MMNISTKGRYATRIMALLATDAAHPSINKFQIAEAESISAAYVQQILIPLKAAGLVESHRGRVGGFSIARSPDTITVGDILRAVEGEIMPAPCRSATHCNRVATCPSRPVWQKAAGLLEELFASITLADMIKEGGLRD